MADDPFPQQPMTRRRKTSAQVLDEAKKAEERARVRLEKKQRKVQKYESVQRSRDRKQDTRRKIVAGAHVLKHCRYDAAFKQQLWAILDQFVAQPHDRAMFGLDPLSPEELAKLLAAEKAEADEARRNRRRKAVE